MGKEDYFFYGYNFELLNRTFLAQLPRKSIKLSTWPRGVTHLLRQNDHPHQGGQYVGDEQIRMNRVTQAT